MRAFCVCFGFFFHSAARKPEKSVIAPTLMHSENPLSSPKAENWGCGVDSQPLVPGLKVGAGGEGSPLGEGALTQCPASPRAYPRGTEVRRPRPGARTQNWLCVTRGSGDDTVAKPPRHRAASQLPPPPPAGATVCTKWFPANINSVGRYNFPSLTQRGCRMLGDIYGDRRVGESPFPPPWGPWAAPVPQHQF